MEALHALSPKLARREEGEKKGGGKSNDNKNKKSKNKSNDDNNRDSNNTSNNRSDGEMAAAIFSMEEAPLSPGYWDKAEGLYFDAAKNVHKGGKNKFQELVTGSATKKVPSKSIEVDNNNHGYFGGGGVGGITGFLTSPRLTGIVRNVFTGAKDFCDFRQMFSPDKCNDEKKNGDRKTTQPSQPFENDEEEEENETKKVQDPGPLVFQPSPKCAKKNDFHRRRLRKKTISTSLTSMRRLKSLARKTSRRLQSLGEDYYHLSKNRACHTVTIKPAARSVAKKRFCTLFLREKCTTIRCNLPRVLRQRSKM